VNFSKTGYGIWNSKRSKNVGPLSYQFVVLSFFCAKDISPSLSLLSIEIEQNIHIEKSGAEYEKQCARKGSGHVTVYSFGALLLLYILRRRDTNH